MARRTLEEAEAQIARMHSELHSYKRSSEVYYVRLRSLENAVRSAIVVGEHIDPDKLYRLRKRVPDKPRPTLRQMREKMYRRQRATSV